MQGGSGPVAARNPLSREAALFPRRTTRPHLGIPTHRSGAPNGGPVHCEASALHRHASSADQLMSLLSRSFAERSAYAFCEPGNGRIRPQTMLVNFTSNARMTI